MLIRYRAVLLLALAVTSPAQGQNVPVPGNPPVPPLRGAVGRQNADAAIGMLAVNAGIGALTATISHMMASDRPRRSRLGSAGWGAAGGSLTFAGKWIASGKASHGGLAGRQVAAIGSSIVRGASSGGSPLSELVFPLGPLRVYASPLGSRDSSGAAQRRRIRVKLDLPGAVGIVNELRLQDSRLDWGESLRSGAPVFITESWPSWSEARTGSQFLGTIRVTSDRSARDIVRRHELVHVLQYDQRHIQWGAAFDAAGLRLIDGGAAIGRWVDPGFVEIPWGLLSSRIDHAQRPWEKEAFLLTEEIPDQLPVNYPGRGW
jgi:hypothetical protein